MIEDISKIFLKIHATSNNPENLTMLRIPSRLAAMGYASLRLRMIPLATNILSDLAEGADVALRKLDRYEKTAVSFAVFIGYLGIVALREKADDLVERAQDKLVEFEENYSKICTTHPKVYIVGLLKRDYVDERRILPIDEPYLNLANKAWLSRLLGGQIEMGVRLIDEKDILSFCDLYEKHKKG